MKYLLLPLLLISLNSFSQGRLRQTTTIIVAYEIKGEVYDIYVRNASPDTSLIQFMYNDTTKTVRLGNWEKYSWKGKAPFTLVAKNITNVYGEWEECGSVREIDKVKIDKKKAELLITDCGGRVIKL